MPKKLVRRNSKNARQRWLGWVAALHHRNWPFRRVLERQDSDLLKKVYRKSPNLVGWQHVVREAQRLRRYNAAKVRPIKPQPKNRAELLARQKKFRPKYAKEV